MNKKRSRKKISRTLVFLALWAVGLLFLAPMALTFTNSFMSAEEITVHYGEVLSQSTGGGDYMTEAVRLQFIPDIVSFRQYKTFLLESPEYLYKFWNSVLLVVPIVALQVAVAALAAYGFALYQGRGRRILFFSYILLMLLPSQVTLVPNYLMTKWLNLLDTRLAVILPGIFAPFSVYLLSKAMGRIPKELIEAASLDGAGPWRIFTQIVLPQCKSTLYSVIILVFIDNWNMVEQVLVLLTDEDKQPLSVFLSQINAGEVSLALAVATVYMIPPLLLFLHGEEHLVAGIADSGNWKE